MASVRPRENTFKVDLTNFPKRPTFEDIHKFVYETLGLTVDHVVRLQMNHAQNCVHIKCRDLQTAQDVVQMHNEKHEIEVNKTKVKVRLVMDDGGVEVKIHDLSENIRNEEIVAFLKQYGDVITIKDQIWSENYPLKGIPTGVRVVKMMLRRHIKSFVTIQGEQTLVTYRNQVHTCKHCTNPSHPGSTCVENKKLLGQKADLNDRLKRAAQSNNNPSTSFASVVNKSTATLMPHFVSLNELASSAPASVATNNTVSTCSLPSVSDQPEIPTATTDGNDMQMKTTGMEEQWIDSAQQNIGEASTSGGITAGESAKQPSAGDQSTHQAATAGHDKATTSSVSVFKIPSNPSNTPNLTMEISDSDSYESSQDNGSFQKVKRRGRPKKPKIDPMFRS